MKTLDELEALARAATPGPWKVRGELGTRMRPFIERPAQPGEAYGLEVYGDDYGLESHGGEEQRAADMKFGAAANPSEILALISDNRSRRNMLDMVINSVSAALERAGVTSVDDPGEAIDVLVADKDAEIARLRELVQAQRLLADSGDA